MKLHLLQQLISEYIKAARSWTQVPWHYAHEIVGHFHTHWSLHESHSLDETYDQSLQSDISQRWWKREQYRPKEIMLQLIATDQELARIAFKDLANDSATLDGRISRFEFYCEELLQMLRRNNPKAIDTYHHQDAAMVSFYLSGMFPEKYTLYPGLNVFTAYCKAIESPDIPKVDDLVRYQKVATTVYKFLEKNPEFQNLLSQRESSSYKVAVIPFQVTYEFISFAGGNRNLEIP